MTNFARILLAGLLTTAAPLYAQPGNTVQACQNFTSAHYLLDHHNILLASQFFEGLATEDLEDESRMLSSEIGSIRLSTHYFDTPALTLLNNGGQLSDQINHNLPRYRQQKERVILQSGKTRLLDLESKTYNRKIHEEDKHPLLGKVRRKDRPTLHQKLALLGIKTPEHLQKTLEVNSATVTRQFRMLGIPVAEISIKNHEIQNYGVPTRAIEFSIARLPSKNSLLTQEESLELTQLLCNIDSKLQKNIPNLQRITGTRYQELYNIAKQKVPLRSTFREKPLIYSIGQAAILSLVGFLFLYLIIERHKEKRIYRQTAINR